MRELGSGTTWKVGERYWELGRMKSALGFSKLALGLIGGEGVREWNDLERG